MKAGNASLIDRWQCFVNRSPAMPRQSFTGNASEHIS